MCPAVLGLWFTSVAKWQEWWVGVCCCCMARWNKIQHPCSIWRLQIHHCSIERLIGMMIETVFSDLQSKCIHGLLLPICSYASIVLWLELHPARYEPEEADLLGMAPVCLGVVQSSVAVRAQGKARVASNACSSLVVRIFWCFWVFLNHDCGIQY